MKSGLIHPLQIYDADLKLYITYIESPNFKDRQGNQIFLKLLKKVIVEFDRYRFVVLQKHYKAYKKIYVCEDFAKAYRAQRQAFHMAAGMI